MQQTGLNLPDLNTGNVDKLVGDILYEDACKYISDFGWALVKLPHMSKGDNTLSPEWNTENNVINTHEKAGVLKSPCNIGIVHQFSGTCVIDVDHEEYARILFAYFGWDYDAMFENCPRIVGRPGHDKALFKAPADILLKTHKIQWPSKEFPNDRTKAITVIELRGGPVQDVLPPSIHPDTKLPYTWRKHPRDGIPELPKELLSIWMEFDKFGPQLKDACPWYVKPESPPIKPRNTFGTCNENIIQKFNDSGSIGDDLVRYGYARKGMRYLAPSSTTGVAGVVVNQKENRCYSFHGSDILGDGYSHDRFHLFTEFEHMGDVKAAFRAAAEIIERASRPTIDDVQIDEFVNNLINKTNKKVPKNVLFIPGKLQTVVDYYNYCAPKRQPQFAVQTAIAIGSVLMGRRFRTDWDNYTSLYLMNVAKSSAGKEHTQLCIDNVLEAVGLSNLVAFGGYASGGGMHTALHEKPCHILVSDEFGRQLESSSKAGVYNHKSDSFTVMLKCYSKTNSVLRPDSYSKMTVKNKPGENPESYDKTVFRPSPTIVLLTTPSTLYDNLNTEYLVNGFLGRIITVEAIYGRQITNKPKSMTIPSDFIEWAQWCATMDVSPEGSNLSDVGGPRFYPEPKTLIISDAAISLFEAYENEILKLQDTLESEGMAELFGRCRENAQRLSLIVAVSCESDIILAEHAKWAIEYIKYYSLQTAEKLGAHISDSTFESVVKSVYKIIKDSEGRGATESKLKQGSRKYRALELKEREKVMKNLLADYPDVILANRKSKCGEVLVYILEKYTHT